MTTGAVETGGLTAIMSRIQQIQSQLSAFAPAGTSASSTSGSDFSAALRTATTSAAGDTSGSGVILPGGTGTTGGVSGADVIADARKYLGVPYVWGGTDPKTGLDCSGLTGQVYRDLGIDLPRVSRDQANVGTPVSGLDQAQAGDLLFFGSPVHHVAIYEGDGMMIEAPHTGQSVKEIKVADFGEPVSGIRRILGSSLDTTGSTSSASALGSAIPAGANAGTVGGSTPYASVINAAAARTGVPASLLAAVAKQESGFNAGAISPAGAQGVMQLMPGTAKSLGVTDPLNATQSINGGASYLASLLTKFGGSTTLALAAYNAGPGAVLKYGGVPPYAETQKYVRNVLALTEASA